MHKTKIFIIIYLSCQYHTLGIQTTFQGKQIHRVLFKKFLLYADETVLCYSKCKPKGKSKMNCEGRKMTFDCAPNHQVMIYQATSYGAVPEHVPEGSSPDICHTREEMKCIRNVTKVASETCNGKKQCTLDLTSGQLDNSCKEDASLAVNVRYTCIFRRVDPKVPSTTTPTIRKTTADRLLVKSDKTGVFWLQNAYSVLYDNELMSKKKAECAMVFLLSLIFGSFIYLCLYLYRWWRKKGDEFKKETIYLLDSQNNESNEANNRALNERILQNERFLDSEDNKKNSIEIIYNDETSGQEKLEELSLLDVTPETYKHRGTPSSFAESLVSTVFSMDTLNGKDVFLNEEQSEYTEDRDILLEKDVKTKVYLDDDIADLRSPKLFTNKRIERYHGSDNYSSSPQILRTLPYHRADYYNYRPKVASTCSYKSNNETSEDGLSIRSLDTHHKHRCFHRQHFHHNPVINEPKEKIFIASNGKQYILKNPRRKYHVSSRNRHTNDVLPLRDIRSKSTYSDNEASIRRKPYKHASRFHNGRNIPEHLHSSMYEMAPHRYRHARSSLSSQCSSSIDENLSGIDNHSRYSTTKRPKHKEFLLEESGYQSHGTATDSMCSSVFSTDHEDGAISSPLSFVAIQGKPRRHRHCSAHKRHHSTQPKDFKTVNVSYKNRNTNFTSPDPYLREIRPISNPIHKDSVSEDIIIDQIEPDEGKVMKSDVPVDLKDESKT